MDHHVRAILATRLATALIRIVVGLLVQLLTAAAGFGVVCRLFSDEPRRNAMLNNPFYAAAFYAIGFGMVYALYLLLPVIAFVMVCENRRFRDWRPYAIASALAVCFVAAQIRVGHGYPIFALLAALVGLVSGLSYWLDVGRFAGARAISQE